MRTVVEIEIEQDIAREDEVIAGAKRRLLALKRELYRARHGFGHGDTVEYEGHRGVLDVGADCFATLLCLKNDGALGKMTRNVYNTKAVRVLSHTEALR